MEDLDLTPKTSSETEAPKERVTIKDALISELKTTIVNEPIILQVQSRPTVKVRFNPNVEWEDLKAWRNRCKDKTQPDGVDPIKFASLLIANTSDGVFFNDQEVFDDSGDSYKFSNLEFLEILNVPKPIEGVKVCYGSDGFIIQTSEAILTAAGYNPDELDIEKSNERFLN